MMVQRQRSGSGSMAWPQGQGFIAATSMKRAGSTAAPVARTTETSPSSSGWRRASSEARPRSAPDEAGDRDGVVRRAEGPFAEQALSGPEAAGDGPEGGGLDRLLEGKRRQERGQPPREHGLAGARRPDEQRVVAAGGRDLQRALAGGLAAHVYEVDALRPRRDRL